jgi:hypothetical protein
MDIVEQLDAERKHNARCNTLLKTAIVDLCESQAREAALRKIVAEFELFETYDDPETPIRDALARIGSDDTALREALKAEYERGYDCGFLVGAEKGRNISEEIKQAKREVLREAANAMAIGAFNTPYGLRRMAKEMK